MADTSSTVQTGPDGRRYRVTGPAGTTPRQHAAAVRSFVIAGSEDDPDRIRRLQLAARPPADPSQETPRAAAARERAHEELQRIDIQRAFKSGSESMGSSANEDMESIRGGDPNAPINEITAAGGHLRGAEDWENFVVGTAFLPLEALGPGAAGATASGLLRNLAAHELEEGALSELANPGVMNALKRAGFAVIGKSSPELKAAALSNLGAAARRGALEHVAPSVVGGLVTTGASQLQHAAIEIIDPRLSQDLDKVTGTVQRKAPLLAAMLQGAAMHPFTSPGEFALESLPARLQGGLGGAATSAGINLATGHPYTGTDLLADLLLGGYYAGGRPTGQNDPIETLRYLFSPGEATTGKAPPVFRLRKTPPGDTPGNSPNAPDYRGLFSSSGSGDAFWGDAFREAVRRAPYSLSSNGGAFFTDLAESLAAMKKADTPMGRFLNETKPSGDPAVTRPEDAAALSDWAKKSGQKMQLWTYSPRGIDPYTPKHADSDIWKRYPGILENRAGPLTGLLPDSYLKVVGASDDRIAQGQFLGAKNGAPIAAIGILPPRNMMREARPLQLYLMELQDAIDHGETSYTREQLDTVISNAAKALKGGDKINSLNDAIEDLDRSRQGLTPEVLNGLTVRNKFFADLAGENSKKTQKVLGETLPGHEFVTDSLTGFKEYDPYDIAAIVYLDTDSPIPPGSAASHGVRPNDTFQTYLPGAFFGQTRPGVNMFGLWDPFVLPSARDQLYNEQSGLIPGTAGRVVRGLNNAANRKDVSARPYITANPSWEGLGK